MKKIISLFLLITMCVSMVSISVHAETEPTLMIGDANFDGKIDVVDALEILKTICGKSFHPKEPAADAPYEAKLQWYYSETIRKGVGNVDGDSHLSVKDALLVLKFVVGKITEFPLTDITQSVTYHLLPAWPGDSQ